MSRYCCFFCPAYYYEDKSLDNKCGTCGRTYGFPLANAPDTVDQYKVIRALSRGFYGVTFLAEKKGIIDTEVVLKVSPKLFYAYFDDKNFQNECQAHARVAKGSDHIVQIYNMGECIIKFGKDEIDCYFAELDYEEGPVLADYLNGTLPISAQMVAQITVDLFRLQQELKNKGVYHNDLHAENIIVKQLNMGQHRAGAIDGSIRAMAIDMGSVIDYSKSDSAKDKYGDLHWICDHIDKLVGRLLQEPDQNEDMGYRLASRLQLIFHMIATDVENQRTPSVEDLIEQITEAYYMIPRHAWQPWRENLNLREFGASYNAQTLHPWHVPLLLVDEDEWLYRIATPGPQVVVGMRGCGKTLFLRALQFHARASKMGSTDSDVLNKIENDKFLGLFVSAQRLLDTPSSANQSDLDPFPRLFIAYALEAIRAVIHLIDVDKSQVVDSAHAILYSAIKEILGNSYEIGEVVSLEQLDQRIDKLLVQVSRGEYSQSLRGHPSAAFGHLADSLRRCAECWANVQVLFLLDDVSTRYLKEPKIRQLLSALIFQHPACAFKMSSEIQTMELGLRTPGENHIAREGRDLSVFDLGSEVYKRIKSPKGKYFVEEILSKRALQFRGHPNLTPSKMLGDCTLEKIAREIASSSQTSKRRKQVYRGLTALAHVCVGDLGDVISLYERILGSRSSGGYPVKDSLQSDCFQDHCSHRLYDLNRRGSELKDVAKSFSEASHELLVRSYRERDRGTSASLRLRQYALIYVRVTTGDQGRQIGRLRELIDAGVFVFAGGSPRTKTKDSDPILQFKLTFRRIYGLVSFIGLSERDRFELSGKELEEWLNDPENGKDILLRNLGGGLEGNEEGEAEECQDFVEDSTKSDKLTSNSSIDLFAQPEDTFSNSEKFKLLKTVDPINVNRLQENELAGRDFGALVLGLGFEERSLHSARSLLNVTRPSKVYAIRYREHGMSIPILKEITSSGAKVEIIDSGSFNENEVFDAEKPVLVDVTSLAKPLIFRIIRNRLMMDKDVYIAHTGASIYYPTDDDLQRLIDAQEEHDRYKFFEILSNIVTGEAKPYTLEPLVNSDADQTRSRVLFAFASSKHERLLSLLDQREFDRLEIIAPDGASPRNRVASEIARIAASDNSNSDITILDSEDLARTISVLLRGFERCYIELGSNFELGLTGSKMQTVAAAAVSSVRKITQAWYVRPQEYDIERFTKGSESTNYFRVSILEK